MRLDIYPPDDEFDDEEDDDIDETPEMY